MVAYVFFHEFSEFLSSSRIFHQETQFLAVSHVRSHFWWFSVKCGNGLIIIVVHLSYRDILLVFRLP